MIERFAGKRVASSKFPVRVSKPPMPHWISKFRNALRGLQAGVRGQSSFYVHFPCALAVVFAAWWLNCEVWQWACLLLCIGIVLSAELFNSALEFLAQASIREENRLVADALDSASAAVLVAAICAAIVGAAILLNQLMTVQAIS
jgi:diacylglycerol kinase